MTKEELIGMLVKDKEQRGNCLISDAIDIAIKVLEQELCEDVISRQAVLTLAKEECETAIIPYRRFVKDINALQSVTPQQKTGHWIRVDKDKLKCSECEVIHLIVQYPQSAKIDYCPNCGAKMQEVQE